MRCASAVWVVGWFGRVEEVDVQGRGHHAARQGAEGGGGVGSGRKEELGMRCVRRCQRKVWS